MTEYHQRRSELISRLAALEPLLPVDEPADPLIPALNHQDLHRLLADPANRHRGTILVLGWGDGSIPRALIGDSFTKQKQVLVAIIAGEEAAFARSLTGAGGNDLLEWGSGTMRLTHLSDRASCESFVTDEFATHERIAILAGVDVIDGHPLATEAQSRRKELTPFLRTLLADRPLSYGNDILDSFTGLLQASANARQLLPAPNLAELAQTLGTIPAIAIGAGPSLQRHLPRLRELQGRCLIVACDAVYGGLVEAGIDPHLVTPLERVPEILPMFAATARSRCVYAGLPVCVSELVQPFGDDRCIGVYGGDRLYDWLQGESAPGTRINAGTSTGTLAVSVALAATRGPVYLIGHDLARDAAGTHWDGAGFASGEWRKAKDISGNERLDGMEDRYILGNDGTMVPSSGHWDRFRSDIVYEVRQARRSGRTVYNVNAHERIFARIDYTEAAPLPDPAQLPIVFSAGLKPPPRQPERYQRWAGAARLLGEDAKAFRTWTTTLRDELDQTMSQDPSTWDPPALASKINLAEPISLGNRQAFSYFLRSALHNLNAEMQLRRRTYSTPRNRWMMLGAMHDLLSALDSTVEKLSPLLEEVAREHAG